MCRLGVVMLANEITIACATRLDSTHACDAEYDLLGRRVNPSHPKMLPLSSRFFLCFSTHPGVGRCVLADCRGCAPIRGGLSGLLGLLRLVERCYEFCRGQGVYNIE